MQKRRVEHGIPLNQTAGPDDFYFRKPAEPATGALGILLSLNGLGLLTLPALWATIMGATKKQKFLLVTGIIGLVLSVMVVVATVAFIFMNEESFDALSQQELLSGTKVADEPLTGRNGITTKHLEGMKLTTDSETTMRFEYVSSLFGTVTVDSSDTYEVLHLSTNETKEAIYRSLVDIDDVRHHTAWTNYINWGDSHAIKAKDPSTSMLRVEYTEMGQVMHALVALKDSSYGIVVVIYSYPVYGSFNEKNFDDKAWQALHSSVTVNTSGSNE